MDTAEQLVFSKTPSFLDKITHYCPGCHHGIAHRLLAECLDEMGLTENTLLVCSIGCSVFIYDYLNVDAIEAPHGRAGAVATGVKRSRPDRTVVSYQGDGDLASIGLCEAIHAANRGERITGVFINNTVYGMTGGQMAPTTLVGQKTTTTPKGRQLSSEGAPLHMAELMANLPGVAFSARCSLDSVAHIKAAKKGVRRALEVSQNNLGYGFIELLSGCPTNWHMDALTANKFISESMIPVFPLGTYKDTE